METSRRLFVGASSLYPHAPLFSHPIIPNARRAPELQGKTSSPWPAPATASPRQFHSIGDRNETAPSHKRTTSRCAIVRSSQWSPLCHTHPGANYSSESESSLASTPPSPTSTLAFCSSSIESDTTPGVEHEWVSGPTMQAALQRAYPPLPLIYRGSQASLLAQCKSPGTGTSALVAAAYDTKPLQATNYRIRGQLKHEKQTHTDLGDPDTDAQDELIANIRLYQPPVCVRPSVFARDTVGFGTLPLQRLFAPPVCNPLSYLLCTLPFSTSALSYFSASSVLHACPLSPSMARSCRGACQYDCVDRACFTAADTQRLEYFCQIIGQRVPAFGVVAEEEEKDEPEESDGGGTERSSLLGAVPTTSVGVRVLTERVPLPPLEPSWQALRVALQGADRELRSGSWWRYTASELSRAAFVHSENANAHDSVGSREMQSGPSSKVKEEDAIVRCPAVRPRRPFLPEEMWQRVWNGRCWLLEEDPQLCEAGRAIHEKQYHLSICEEKVGASREQSATENQSWTQISEHREMKSPLSSLLPPPLCRAWMPPTWNEGNRSSQKIFNRARRDITTSSNHSGTGGGGVVGGGNGCGAGQLWTVALHKRWVLVGLNHYLQYMRGAYTASAAPSEATAVAKDEEVHLDGNASCVFSVVHDARDDNESSKTVRTKRQESTPALGDPAQQCQMPGNVYIAPLLMGKDLLRFPSYEATHGISLVCGRQQRQQQQQPRPGPNHLCDRQHIKKTRGSLLSTGKAEEAEVKAGEEHYDPFSAAAACQQICWISLSQARERGLSVARPLPSPMLCSTPLLPHDKREDLTEMQEEKQPIAITEQNVPRGVGSLFNGLHTGGATVESKRAVEAIPCAEAFSSSTFTEIDTDVCAVTTEEFYLVGFWADQVPDWCVALLSPAPLSRTDGSQSVKAPHMKLQHHSALRISEEEREKARACLLECANAPWSLSSPLISSCTGDDGDGEEYVYVLQCDLYGSASPRVSHDDTSQSSAPFSLPLPSLLWKRYNTRDVIVNFSFPLRSDGSLLRFIDVHAVFVLSQKHAAEATAVAGVSSVIHAHDPFGKLLEKWSPTHTTLALTSSPSSSSSPSSPLEAISLSSSLSGGAEGDRSCSSRPSFTAYTTGTARSVVERITQHWRTSQQWTWEAYDEALRTATCGVATYGDQHEVSRGDVSLPTGSTPKGVQCPDIVGVEGEGQEDDLALDGGVMRTPSAITSDGTASRLMPSTTLTESEDVIQHDEQYGDEGERGEAKAAAHRLERVQASLWNTLEVRAEEPDMSTTDLPAVDRRGNIGASYHSIAHQGLRKRDRGGDRSHRLYKAYAHPNQLAAEAIPHVHALGKQRALSIVSAHEQALRARHMLRRGKESNSEDESPWILQSRYTSSRFRYADTSNKTSEGQPPEQQSSRRGVVKTSSEVHRHSFLSPHTGKYTVTTIAELCEQEKRLFHRRWAPWRRYLNVFAEGAADPIGIFSLTPSPLLACTEQFHQSDVISSFGSSSSCTTRVPTGSALLDATAHATVNCQRVIQVEDIGIVILTVTQRTPYINASNIASAQKKK